MELPNSQSGDESLSRRSLVNEVVSGEELSKQQLPNEEERRSELLLVHVWSYAYRIARQHGWQHVDCEDIAQETSKLFLLRGNFNGTVERFFHIKVKDTISRIWRLLKKRKEIRFSQLNDFDIADLALVRIREAEEILEWLQMNCSLRRFNFLIESIDGYSQDEIAARHKVSPKTVERDICKAKREILAKFGGNSND